MTGEECDDGNLIGHDGCSSNCKTEQPVWDNAVTSLPTPARSAASMVYDSARGRIVMFGGYTPAVAGVSSSATLGDTWEWDGTGWISVTTAIAPTPREGHAMAYDSTRHRVVLYGGELYSGVTSLDDTWEYDGTSWTLLEPAHSPPGRAFAAAAYDSARHRVVLFGGKDSNGNALDETWEWDGTDWAQITLATNPPARPPTTPPANMLLLHAMAYDPMRAVVVMAGGGIQDTWEYDGSQWLNVTPSNPVNQTKQIGDFGMTYDRVTKLVITYGGVTAAGDTTDTWGWNGEAWSDLLLGPGTMPATRRDMAMAADPVRGTVILTGGYSVALCGPIGHRVPCDTTLGDAWSWNGTTWSSITVAAPSPRSGIASALDTARGRLVIYGGYDNGTGIPETETWEFDGGHWTQYTGATAPSPRGNDVMAFDSKRGQTVLFGGYNTSTGAPLTDTWIWKRRGVDDAGAPAELAGELRLGIGIRLGARASRGFRRCRSTGRQQHVGMGRCDLGQPRSARAQPRSDQYLELDRARDV